MPTALYTFPDGETRPLDTPPYVDDAKVSLTDNARTIFMKRYARKTLDGSLQETPAGVFYRVAYHVAQGEPDETKRAAMTEQFYHLLASRRFFPNSPTFTGAGTRLGQLAACFVLGLTDDMGKDPQGIFSTLRVAALIQQTGGGNGFSFGKLRPKRDQVTSTGGQATGPVGFLKMYDACFGEVEQGGLRRGANMAVLPVHHPDIREFITCKTEEGKIANFNISVGVTDAFMEAVTRGENFALLNPRNGEVWDTVDARTLFDEIVKQAHHNGEPGLLFLDAANRANPVPHLYTLEATNPCFAPDTLIQTRNGHFPIRDLVGRSVEVWDGNQWVATDSFRMTGRFQPMLRLELQSGDSLTVTPYHQMILEDGSAVKAKDLRVNDKLMLSNAPLSHGSLRARGAYLKGFLLGDGTYSSTQNRPVLWLYPPKKICADRLLASLTELEPQTVRTNVVTEVGFRESHFSGQREVLVLQGMTPMQDELYPWVTTYKEQLPSEVFAWDSSSKLDLLAGIFDADGTASEAGGRFGYQLSSIHKAYLLDVKLLLKSVGIQAKLALMKPAGERDWDDGYGNYRSRACWRLVLSQTNSIALAKLIKFERLKDFSTKQVAYSRPSPYNQVVAIQEAGVEEEVYCCTIDSTHRLALTCGLITGQCGEQWLGPYENCCLGSINLAEHWKTVAGLPVVDWEKLADSTRMATFFLDDVVTINAYVPVVPELRQAAEASRRIGLGIMGLADLLYALHLPYDSEGGRALASQVMEFIRYYTLSTSVDLALERGSFKGYAGSVYDFNQPGGMPWQPPHATQPTDYAFGRPTLYWDSLRRNVEDFGIRNACQTTIAPTGTLSSVAGCEGYGCEPVFALGYIRHFKDGQKDVELPYVSTAFQNALGHLNLGLDTERAILDHVARTGTCQDLPILPEAFRRTFVVSGDIAPRDHVLMQAALQHWVDNSISKTINLPDTATPEDVKEVYQLAWELGCKGITVYVTGSRDKVVLETQVTKTQKADPLAEALSALTNAATVVEAAYLERMRPPALQGVTIRKDTPLGKAYITVNEDEQQEPFEVFINVGKAGSATTAISEGFGRLISLFLRSPSPMVPRARLAQVVEELAGIGGNRPWGFGNGRVLSLPDGIAKVLAQYLSGDNGHAATKAEAPDVPPQPFGFVVGDLCPDCGDATFVQVEGCRKCLACGYSEC